MTDGRTLILDGAKNNSGELSKVFLNYPEEVSVFTLQIYDDCKK